MKSFKLGLFIFVVMSTLVAAGCTATQPDVNQLPAAASQPARLSLPELSAANLNGAPLKVVATTSIIGDVVAQVGGEAIDLTTLMPLGQDPHSYEPAAQDLTAVAAADIIFVNGWNLEESLARNLASIGKDVPVVAVSANITPLLFGVEAEHGLADPHTWFDIQNVQQWVTNIETVLSQRDPANTDLYAQNAAAYHKKLAELATYVQAELGSIPAEKRFLITNHDSLGYLAQAYGFEVLGTVIPGMSTLAEPSARELADLINVMTEHNVCTLFIESTVSDSLAKTVAAELTACDTVQVISLYTGSLGPAGSGTDNYIGMFRANVDAIVAGLK